MDSAAAGATGCAILLRYFLCIILVFSSEPMSEASSSWEVLSKYWSNPPALSMHLQHMSRKSVPVAFGFYFWWAGMLHAPYKDHALTMNAWTVLVQHVAHNWWLTEEHVWWPWAVLFPVFHCIKSSSVHWASRYDVIWIRNQVCDLTSKNVACPRQSNGDQLAYLFPPSSLTLLPESIFLPP